MHVTIAIHLDYGRPSRTHILLTVLVQALTCGPAVAAVIMKATGAIGWAGAILMATALPASVLATIGATIVFRVATRVARTLDAVIEAGYDPDAIDRIAIECDLTRRTDDA